MVSVPFGKASITFKLSMSRSAVLGVLAAEDEGVIGADVVGFTTQKTFEAGASSLRVKLHGDALAPEPGAHLVAVRSDGSDGFLPGLASPRCGGSTEVADDIGMEIVIFGRPDKHWKEVMYLPEDVLQNLFPPDSAVELRMIQALAPVQRDCPPQWLRDRLLRLADGVDTNFADACPGLRDNPHELRNVLEQAGLSLTNVGAEMIVMPADHGKRVGEEELGYWNEEMKLNTRCGATLEGGRQDGKDAAKIGVMPSFPGIEAML